MTEPRIVLFDLKHTGHHANYIRHLIKHWQTLKLDGKLYVVVSPQFIEQHQATVKLASDHENFGVEFVSISHSEFGRIQNIGSTFDRMKGNLREWNLLCKYTAQLKANHCLVMYLDTCELPLVLGLKPPCPLSGIYFRPTFHYSSFLPEKLSKKEKLQQWRDRLFLDRTLRNPQLHTLFCLDPLVDQSIKKLYPSVRAVPLEDPIEIPVSQSADIQPLRAKHKIPDDRKVFILFGSIDSRKGIYKLLQALKLLSSEICKTYCFLIVGPASSADQARICAEIDLICQDQPLQVVTHFEFISDAEVEAYFQLADVVLALYQRHVGMSGILLLAAAAQKPIISSDYGLMGELTRRYGLGTTLDSTAPQAIADELTQIYAEQGLDCDLEGMQRFVDGNSASKFAKTIFDHIHPSPALI
ncbi:MAG: glycosyltransferase [Nodosilinea sp.]